MAYQITWEPEGVLTNYSGFLSAREMAESATKLQADPRFDEMRYVINDLSRVSGHDLTEDSILQIAVLNYGAHASNPNCRIAYATADERLTKIIRATLMMPSMKSYEVEVKPTASEARDWLSSKPRLHEISSIQGIRIR